MWDKFRYWYTSNYSAITWFVIGFLVSAGVYDLAQGDYAGAVLDFGIAFVNYLFVRRP